jgi:hypothetical protein
MAESFKRGQQVIVRLSRAHEIEGDPFDHPAKFVGYHPGGDWVDIELEREHAGGTKKLSVPASFVKARG